MIAIVDYKAGNLASVERAVSQVGFTATITADPAVVQKAERVIFPGVGAAGQAMESLRKSGMAEALADVVQAGKGLLGICLGSQIILDSSEENATQCLGLLPGATKLLPVVPQGLKVPHMGWNQVQQQRDHQLFAEVPEDATFYFVHSYYTEVDQLYTLGVTQYGITFPSVIGNENILAVQFHIEKSGQWGQQILKNFLTMDF